MVLIGSRGANIMTRLPTEAEIKKLTLRAIAAYAARCARRGSATLRPTIPDAIIEAPLHTIEKYASVIILDRSDMISVCSAGFRVSQVMSTLVGKQKCAALCLTALIVTVRGLHEAARYLENRKDPVYAQGAFLRAIKEAAAIPSFASDALDEPAATAAMKAARRDYEVLSKHFGGHQEIVLGEPIDLSNEWWLRNA